MFITRSRLEQGLSETRQSEAHSHQRGGGRHNKKNKPQQQPTHKQPQQEATPSEGSESAAAATSAYQLQLPHFVRWILNDVKREGEDELEASGLKWEDVAVAVEVAARRLFQAEVLNKELG